MGFTRDDFNNMDTQLQKITSQKVEEINIDNKVPTTDDLKDNNKTNSIDAAILFIDIRKSTELTDMTQPKTMVKIYRSFMRMSVDCVRKNNGVTRQFLGDRIMGVFYNIKDDEDNIISSAVDNAINCARALQTCISFSLNKYLKNNVNNKIISCGIGIDYGKVLVTKVGMLGTENNDEKENEMNCVWVSKITNYASKYSDISEGDEILISENVFSKISQELKEGNNWTKVTRVRNRKQYTGYCISDYYLDYSNELGDAIKDDTNNTIETEKEFNSLIDKINKKYEELIQEEKQLTIKEEKIKFDENKNSEDEHRNRNLLYETFDYVDKIIRTIYLQDDLIRKIGLEKINELLNLFYEIGKLRGKEKDELDLSILPHLIEIYSIFGSYEDSYNYMVKMVENSTWLTTRRKEALKWAKENSETYKLKSALDKKIKDSDTEEQRNEWAKYKNEVLKIWEG